MAKSPTPPAPLTPIHTRYIQKSNAFLYPLLGLPRAGEGVFQPNNTYLRLKGVFREYDHKLIVSYKNPARNSDWDRYQAERLLNHPMLDSSVLVPGTSGQPAGRVLYLFDLSGYAADVNLFLAGKYSQLSPAVRQLICAHYGIQTAEWAHIEGLLYPLLALPRYAKLLGMPAERLLVNGELCPPFDPVHETLSVELPDDFVELLVL